jgi:phosphatidylglycerol:prolipoprotein diacylglycerol transferase
MLPYLFHHGRFALPTYGVLSALGLVIGLAVAVRLAQRREHVAEDHVWNIGIIVVVGGIVGAKLLYLIYDWDFYSQHLREVFTLDFLQTAGVFSGGLALAVAMGSIYVLWNRLPYLRLSDAFAPGIAIGHAIGRLGCLAAGCCYGKPTDKPWGITFTSPIAHAVSHTPLFQSLHPTQIYESAGTFAVFLICMWVYKRRTFAGQVAGTYLFLYGIVRYVVEFWRDDPERGSMFGGIMSGTQFLALLMVVLGALLWLRLAAVQRRPVAIAA